MSPKKQLRNLHAKAYIQEVFESILRAEGFQCPDDRLLCWYRIHNEEVVNSIIFYTQYPNLPLMLGIGYGIFPSFQKPFYLSNVVSNDHPGQEEHFVHQPIIENNRPEQDSYAAFSDDVLVYAPLAGGRGKNTLEGVLLPHMNQIHTLQDVYEYHKRRLEGRPMAKHYGAYSEISKTFISMAYILEDEQMYPFCKARIEKNRTLFETLSLQFPDRKKYQDELAGWKELEELFKCGDRTDFIGMWERRKHQNLNYLRNKMHIL